MTGASIVVITGKKQAIITKIEIEIVVAVAQTKDLWLNCVSSAAQKAFRGVEFFIIIAAAA